MRLSLLVDFLAAEVDGSDQGGIELAAPQGTRSELQSAKPGIRASRNRVAGAAEIELAVQTVGWDIRHRAYNTSRGQGRDNVVGAALQPFAVLLRIET